MNSHEIIREATGSAWKRSDVIRACDEISAANAKLQQACKNILEILERSSKRDAVGDPSHASTPQTVA